MMNFAQIPMLHVLPSGLTPPYVRQRKWVQVSGTSFNVSFNSTPLDGSYLLCCIPSNVSSGYGVTGHASWNLIYNQLAGTVHRSRIWSKIASSEPASYTWTQAQNRTLHFQVCEIVGYADGTYEDLDFKLQSTATSSVGYSPAKDIEQGRLIFNINTFGGNNSSPSYGESFTGLYPTFAESGAGVSLRSAHREFDVADNNITIPFSWSGSVSNQSISFTFKGL